MLEHNKPLVVRDLTRGTQTTLHHDLNEREIEVVRAGGLLSAGARAGVQDGVQAGARTGAPA